MSLTFAVSSSTCFELPWVARSAWRPRPPGGSAWSSCGSDGPPAPWVRGGERLELLIAQLEIAAKARDLAVLLRDRRRRRRDRRGESVDTLGEHVEARHEPASRLVSLLDESMTRRAFPRRGHRLVRRASGHAPGVSAPASARLAHPAQWTSGLQSPRCQPSTNAAARASAGSRGRAPRRCAAGHHLGHAVADEPAPDDDTGPTAPRPAVHVDDAAGVELGVDLVEDRDEVVAGRNREVADRPVEVPGGGSTSDAYGSSSPVCVRSTKSVTPASTRSRTSSPAFSAPQAHGWRPAMSASGLDDGGRAHEGEVCRRCRYPVRGERLKRHSSGCR